MSDNYVDMPDLTQETAATLDGSEQFVMFDSSEGKRATLSAVKTKILAGISLEDLGFDIDTSISGTSENPVQNKVIKQALDGKVDTVSGKGLSANDYTDTEKNKLSGIEAQANKTVVDSAMSDSSTNPVQNKVIYEELEDKANIDGYYESMSVGYAGNLISGVSVEDQTPYLFRQTAGGVPVGNREYLKNLVGGTVAWNQLMPELIDNNGYKQYNYTTTRSFDNGVVTLTSSGNADIYNSNCATISSHKYLSTFDIYPTDQWLIAKEVSGTVYINYNYVGDYLILNSWNRMERVFSSTVGSYNYIATHTGSKIKNWMLHDLTAMYGSTIADYIYSLEQATAGAGVAWLKQHGFMTKPYYAYDAGGLQSVKTSAHKMVGFNQWDESQCVKRNGKGRNDSGTEIDVNVDVGYTANMTAVIGGVQYCLSGNVFNGNATPGRIYYIDANDNFIERSSLIYSTPHIFTPPTNCRKIQIQYATVTFDESTICINISDPQRNGEYEPYSEHIYALGGDDLRGIFYLDSNNQLRCNGDVKTPDGSIDRRYGVVDLGTLGFSYNPNTYLFSAALPNGFTSSSNTTNCISAMYIAKAQVANGNMWMNNGNIYIVNVAYTDAATFKQAMSGVYLVYELATHTTESADPYTGIQVCDPWGTEEYTEDLRAKLEGLPWDLSMIAPIENGTKASQAYSSGQYFLKDDQFCKALTSIASGATFTLNTNYAVTTVAAEIYTAINS